MQVALCLAGNRYNFSCSSGSCRLVVAPRPLTVIYENAMWLRGVRLRTSSGLLRKTVQHHTSPSDEFARAPCSR